MATIIDLLASILNPNPGQNRLVAPNANGPNYLTQTGLSPDQLARFHQMSGMGGQAAPATTMPHEAAPAIGQQQAPQPDQTQTAAVAPPQAEGGGFLSRLFGGGQADGENQTIQWLQQQGMDPGTATMMAKSKPILQAYLLKRSQGKQRNTTTIDGKLIDTDTGEIVADYSKPAAQVRDLTPDEVKQRGYPAGSYQVDEKGNVSTVGGAREQDPTFGREKDIRQEYENSPIVKGYQIVRDNYERIRQGSTLTTGAGDLAIVFGYMKMLDPTSVVREGEQAAATDVSGVPSRIRNLYNSVAAGEKLPPEARAELLAAAQQVYGEASKNLGDLNTRYSGIASQWQLDPARIVQPPEAYDPLLPPDQQTPAPGAPIPPPGGAPVPPPAAAVPGAVDVSKMPPPDGISPEVWKHVPPEKRKLWAQ